MATDTLSRTQKRLQHTGLPLAPTQNVNQGDLIRWDAAANTVRPVTSDAEAATLLGVSDTTSPVPSVTDRDRPSMVNALYGDEFLFGTVAGRTYTRFASVFVQGGGAGPQTVTDDATGRTNPVGFVVLPQGINSLAGGTGVKVAVYVQTRHPNTDIN